MNLNLYYFWKKKEEKRKREAESVSKFCPCCHSSGGGTRHLEISPEWTGRRDLPRRRQEEAGGLEGHSRNVCFCATQIHHSGNCVLVFPEKPSSSSFLVHRADWLGFPLSRAGMRGGSAWVLSGR